MNSIRRFFAETDFRDLMFFVMVLVLPAVGGFAGAWLAMHLAGSAIGVCS